VLGIRKTTEKPISLPMHGAERTHVSPVALEAVKRIDALFEIGREINGLSAEERLRVRQEQSVAPCGGVAA
jgi:hypothetical protein